jgi:hypothetical protein
LDGAGLAARHRVFTLNTIDVDVRDVSDPAMIAAIRRTVQRTFSHLVGVWHVQLSASDSRGQWHLRIRGAFGRHFAPFWASSDALADSVERGLRTFLCSMVVPLDARPRRPVLVPRGFETERSQPRIERQPSWENPQKKAS